MCKNFITNRGEASTLVVVGLLVLVGVAGLLTTTLNQDRQTTNTRASESCTFDSGAPLALGGTETDTSNSDNRVPISSNRYYYDTLQNTSGFERINDEGVLTLTKEDTGRNDAGVANMMATMFGYKPKRLSSALKPPNEGGTYILEVPTDAGHPDIKMPSTGYDIGGGYEAMVTFAAEDRVTLHIGPHEYFTGTKTCKDGKTCSGGYWIYIKGICVDKQIVNAYNGVKAAQEAAGADLNPIQLPMVRPGQVVGKAQGTSVFVGVRDNGTFISIFKPFYWGGVSEVDTGTGTPPTQTANQPTAISTPIKTPTPVTCTNGSILCPGTSQCAPENFCGSFPTNTPTPIPTKTPILTNTPIPVTQPSASEPQGCNIQISKMGVAYDSGKIGEVWAEANTSSLPSNLKISFQLLDNSYLTDNVFTHTGDDDAHKFSAPLEKLSGPFQDFINNTKESSVDIYVRLYLGTSPEIQCSSNTFTCNVTGNTGPTIGVECTTPSGSARQAFRTTEDRTTEGQFVDVGGVQGITFESI